MADTAKIISLIKGIAKVNAEDIQTSVDGWLDDHPEATTTVEDGAITLAKLNSGAVATVAETQTYLGM